MGDGASILIVHGTRDDVIPYRHGEELLPAQPLRLAEAVQRTGDKGLVLAEDGMVLVVLPRGGSDTAISTGTTQR